MVPSSWPARLRHFLSRRLWELEPERRTRLSALRLLQFSIMLGEGFIRDRLLLRASALTYFTVLSLVPLLGVAVGIAGALGAGGTDFVDWAIGVLAGGAPEAEAPLRRLIARVDFQASGTLGAIMLFVTTVLAIGNVESAFNVIWGVKSGRGWARRFSDYLAVLVVAPLLGGLALSWAATLRSQWAVLHLPVWFGFVDDLGGMLIPVGMLSVAFAFLYWFLPNARVRPASAALGGVVAGLLVVVVQSLWVHFSVGAARADVFFGGFALIPLLFAWIYVFWGLVLLGAEIAFAHQNFALYRREVRGRPAGPAEREAIALRIALEAARRFQAGAAPPDASELADELQVPVRTVHAVATELREVGILSLRIDEQQEESFQLGRPAESIRVLEVLRALRGRREKAAGSDGGRSRVAALLDEIEDAVETAAGDLSLADLLEKEARGDVAPPGTPR